MVTREYLQSHALFGGVDDDAMADIIPLMRHETYTKGAYVVREGDPESQMYFIRAGTVEVVKFSDTHARNCGLRY